MWRVGQDWRARVMVLVAIAASAPGGEASAQERRVIGGEVGAGVVALAADVAVSSRRVTNNGAPAAAAIPRQEMRFERRLDQGRWLSTVVFKDVDRPKVREGQTDVELVNPFRIARVELDEEKGETRAFDARGRRVDLPTSADRQRLTVDAKTTAATARRFPVTPLALPKPPTGPQPWLSGLVGDMVAHARDKAKRQQEIAAKAGPKTGTIRSLNRHVRVEGDEAIETLVDPDVMLPVEINVVKGGRLVQRTEMRYAPHGDGHVREFVRVEREAGGGSTDRVITEIQLSNVVTPGGRP